MTRYLSFSLMLVGLFIATAGCGGSTKPTTIEAPDNYQPSDIDLEMQSEEYEKAMNEMQ